MVLEALGRGGFSEEGFYDELVRKAMVEGDTIAFQELLKRFHPVPKSVAPYIEIEYPHNGTIPEKAVAIEKGVFSGDIPPDVGIGLIGALSNIANIDAVHDLKLRIESLEKAFNV